MFLTNDFYVTLQSNSGGSKNWSWESPYKSNKSDQSSAAKPKPVPLQTSAPQVVGAVGVVESVSVEYNWLDQVQPHGPSSHYALGLPNKRSLHANKQIDSSYSAVAIARGSNGKNNSTERSVLIGWCGIDHGLAQSL